MIVGVMAVVGGDSLCLHVVFARSWMGSCSRALR